MLTPSTTAWPPADGRIDPVVKPSMSSFCSPASLIAAIAVSTAIAPIGRDDRRVTSLMA